MDSTIRSIRPESSPLEPILHPLAVAAKISLYCKRDDRYGWTPDSPLQGNKVRKLLPLLQRTDLSDKTIISFGGAYSNHVAALSEAGKRFGFATHFFIRGEPVTNAVLERVRKNGSRLCFLSRTDYRRKEEKLFQQEIGITQSDIIIPEGGTTPEALTYTGEAFTETTRQLGRPPDYFCTSAGTGGTAAGCIIAAKGTSSTIEVYPALKGNWMQAHLLQLIGDRPAGTFSIVSDYHFGGYAKFPRTWVRAAPDGALATRADIGEPQLPTLEPIYTAKLFYGVLDRISQGCYPAGCTVVVLHTGGIY